MAQFTEARRELNKQASRRYVRRRTSWHRKQRLADRSEGYELAMQARDAQTAEMGRLVWQELQQQLAGSQEMLAASRAESKQLRLTADAERRRQEEMEVNHHAERTRLEERAQAQERRLNAEVDRVRQESKRLALKLESETRESAKFLSASLEKAWELRPSWRHCRQRKQVWSKICKPPGTRRRTCNQNLSSAARKCSPSSTNFAIDCHRSRLAIQWGPK